MGSESPARLQCPYIVFRLHDGLFTLNSEMVSSIMLLPHLEPLPEAPAHLPGIFTYRDEAVPAMDLRSALGMQTLKQEFEDFSVMLDMRKQDHVNWVNELERCMEAGEKFKLTTDPHQCAFGKWYDHYQTDNTAIQFQLRKIDEPHRLLHHAAEEVEACEQLRDSAEREACARATFERVKNQYMPQVLKLLEETKHVLRDSYREMVLVIGTDGRYLGVIVDEVLSVEELAEMDSHNLEQFNNTTGMVIGVKKSERRQETILELNSERLFEGIRYC